jgi:arabinan endo-1,5-alpha-L-arabinosidase
MHFVTLLSFVFTLFVAAYGYASPGACSGACGNAHDPAIIRRGDGRYFRLSTGGRIAIHSAPNITGPWTFHGAAIPSGSKINLKGNKDLWVRGHPPETLQQNKLQANKK